MHKRKIAMNTPHQLAFNKFIASRSRRLEKLLKKHLTLLCTTTPRRFHQAINYSVLNGGKRFRSLLVYILGKAQGTKIHSLDSAALALEFIHTFSLIHDDLPAMDNDKLRRGKPTLHLAFDEATAILAGDALLAMAFQIISKDTKLTAQQRVAMLGALSQAAGPQGMAGGQYHDLHPNTRSPTTGNLEKMYAMKTGALIEAAFKLGAIATGVLDGNKIRLMKQLARMMGIAFQIQDDLANIMGNAHKMGKATGTDRKNKKITYPLFLGIAKTRNKLFSLKHSMDNIIKRLRLQNSFLPLLLNNLFS